METGTVLTSASSYSSLQEVGALHKGSLVTGFGAIQPQNRVLVLRRALLTLLVQCRITA